MIEEADICALLQAGEVEQAFECLLERLSGKVLNLARSLVRDETLAQDMAQETFVKVWRNLDHYAGQSSFSTWIYAIARNTCFTELKKRAIRPTVSFDESGWEEILERPDQETLAPPSFRTEQDIRPLVNSLPDKYRCVLMLYYFDERTYEEMADLLGIPIGTVKTNLFRAKRELLERVQKADAAVRGGIRTGAPLHSQSVYLKGKKIL